MNFCPSTILGLVCALVIAWWGAASCTPTLPNEPRQERNQEQPPNSEALPITEAPPITEAIETPIEPQAEPASVETTPEPDMASEPATQETSSPDEPAALDAGPSEPSPPTESSADATSQSACDGRKYTFMIGQDAVTLGCTTSGVQRTYELQTTHPLRDNLPPNQRITITEIAGQPSLRSGHLLFDSLYAMAIQEARQNSVTEVKEGAFQQGKAYPCACFQTGEKWTWAWTRDSAYAIDLGLAALDPVRSFNTLMFKLSSTKTGLPSTHSPQIVQDTGTGGSWPVSSDRVVWATGLRQLLYYHTNPITTQVFDPLLQTLLHDRKWIFDQEDGLYRGEQSFLDWREQSYPSWSRTHIETIAMSKTLSTNVNHLVAIMTLAELAKTSGQTTTQRQMEQWATALRAAIAKEFRLTGTPLLSTMKTHTLAPAATRRFDLLGNALAILFDVVAPTDAAAIVAAYPHTLAGAPVQWPQQPLTPIYHNRSIWPFVTAYWLRAAKKVRNAEVVAHNMRSLYRGAALNLSHMENFEMTTLANDFKDGAYSGPVINSRRQLWSVAGYLSAIQDVIFGLEASGDASQPALAWKPYLPRALRKEWFANQQHITLHQFQYRGKSIDVTLQLPPLTTDTSDAYAIKSVSLNGTTIPDAPILASSLQATNQLVLQLVDPSSPATRQITIIEEKGDFRRLWSPKEAQITSIQEVNGKLQLHIDSLGEVGTEHVIYRDGVEVAKGVKAGMWQDIGFTDLAGRSPCYSVVASFPTSGNSAHHSLPVCWWGNQSQRLQEIDAWQWVATGGQWGYGPGGDGLFRQWGAPGDTLEASAFQPYWTGVHYLRLRYRNPTGVTSTGITAATKQIEVIDPSNNQIVATGTVVMPQSGNANEALSTLLKVTLDASKRYLLRIKDPQDQVNMSYFSHFADYNGGAGGGSTSTNQAEIIALQIWPIAGQDKTPTTGALVVFDGQNDLDKLPTSQHLTPGATLASWERVGLTWDLDWLYLSVVSKGFEQPLKAFILYLEASSTAPGVAQPSTGMTYLQLSPALPFTPTHAIGLRQQTDNNDGFGPWNGLWQRTTSHWELQRRWKPGRDAFVSADKHTISVRIPRSQLGNPQYLRIAGHLVHTGTGNEWKDTFPSTHTPWSQSTTGYLEIQLTPQASGVAQWKVR